MTNILGVRVRIWYAKLASEISRFPKARPSAAKTLPCSSGLIRKEACAAMRTSNRELRPNRPQLDGQELDGDCHEPAPAYMGRPRIG